MVGKGPMPSRRTADREPRRGAARAPIRSWTRSRAAATEPVYLVGGAVRDLLLGRGRADIDLVVVGDAGGAGRRARAPSRSPSTSASPPPRSSSTATSSTSPAPAPRPTRIPARCPRWRRPPSIEADLGAARLHVNAMAIPLRRRAAPDRPPRRPRRPRGRAAAGPAPATPFATTRPGRSAPPATRPASASSSSRRRRSCCGRPTSAPSPPTAAQAELLRLAGRSDGAARASSCSPSGACSSCARAGSSWPRGSTELLGTEPWSGEALARPEAVLAAALGPAGGEGELAAARPERPSEAVELARGHDPVELVLARALGRRVARRVPRQLALRSALEIDGADLIAAGVPQGPALGRGLAAALRRQARRRDRRPRARSWPSALRRLGGRVPAPTAHLLSYGGWSGERATGCGGWRPSSGRRAGRLRDPARRRQRGAVRQPQPRRPHRGRARRR